MRKPLLGRLACIFSLGFALSGWQPVGAQLVPLTPEMVISEPFSNFSSNPRVAALPQGRFLAGWEWFDEDFGVNTNPVRFIEAEGMASGEIPIQLFELPGPFPLASSIRTGEMVAAAIEGTDCAVLGQIWDSTLDRLRDVGPIIPQNPTNCPFAVQAALFANSRGAFLFETFIASFGDLHLQRFNAAGQAEGTLLRVPLPTAPEDPVPSNLQADLAANASGSAVVAWWTVTAGGPNSVIARWVDGNIGALGPQVEIARDDGSGQVAPPKVAIADSGITMVVWARIGTPFQLVGQLFDTEGHARTEPFLLWQSDRSIPSYDLAVDTLGRFVVVWTEVATADPLGPWNLYAQLFNSQGLPASPVTPVNEEPFRATTPSVAFGDQRTVLVSWNREGGSAEGAVVARLFSVPPTPCDFHEESFCLQNDRFLVEVEWTDFQGNTGPGKVVPTISDQSGLFWFFNPENWELLVKVLDGCAINDHVWVFSAATTNVGYRLRVTDLFTGDERLYFNTLGVNAPAVTDTTAFASCP